MIEVNKMGTAKQTPWDATATTVEERKQVAALESGRTGNAGMNKHRAMTRIKCYARALGMHGFNRHPSLRPCT